MLSDIIRRICEILLQITTTQSQRQHGHQASTLIYFLTCPFGQLTKKSILVCPLIVEITIKQKMELLTFNTDISPLYPHILRKIHAQFNTIISDNSEAV